jgi:predicted ATP-dependent protease
MCCLLSALTGIPLRQDLAMTGAIDQHGHIQPIGAVTEKIEGFYYVCKDVGLTGEQGVIIPQSNVVNLMLRPEVVEACEAEKFHVYAVSSIREALEIFTGREAGTLDDDGQYPEGTLLAEAVQKAFEYWLLAARPASVEWQEVAEAQEDEDPTENAEATEVDAT